MLNSSRPMRVVAVSLLAATLTWCGSLASAVEPEAPSAGATGNTADIEATWTGDSTPVGASATTAPRPDPQTTQPGATTTAPMPLVTPTPMQVAQTIDDYCATTTTGTPAYVACVEAAMRALATAGPSATPTAGLSEAQAKATVVRLLARLTVPDPTISLGPDPSVNEWNMAVVGYPLWLWTSESDTRSTSVSEGGLTITVRAHRDRVTYDMGDGSAPIVCTSTTPYPGTHIGMVPSPTCGYTYQRRPDSGSTYTITARAHWVVTWTYSTYNGTLNLNTAAQRTLKVGELQSLVVANR